LIQTTALQTFREIQRLLSKTNGKVIGDVMSTSPIVVRESTNLDAATKLLLETKYSKLPVVDSTGKLVSGFMFSPLCSSASA
jgi:CBS domain-containing protein